MGMSNTSEDNSSVYMPYCLFIFKFYIAGSEGQLKDLTSSPRKSAPNSAKSDIRKHKPLPPIGAITGMLTHECKHE